MTDIKNTNQTDLTRSEHEDEIDLIQLAKTLWEGRKAVIKTTIIFMLIGLFVAIFSEKEYTASCTIVPQSAEGGSKLGGSLGGLAAMAGINLGSMGGGSNISPALYPKIIKSVPFQKELMNTPLSIEGEHKQVTFAEYYLNIKKPGLLGCLKKYTIGLPRELMNLIRETNSEASDLPNVSNRLLAVSSNEVKLIEILNSQIYLMVNDKDGYVSINVRMPEARAAAQLTQRVQELLQKSITEIKIKKANDELLFVQKRFLEKEQEAEQAQAVLAEFLDKNKNVSTAIAQTKREKLTADYNLIYGVYSELAKQLEKQKIQVKEDTPIFVVIEPVSIPLFRSHPQRAKLLVLWTIIGLIIGVTIVVVRNYWVLIKGKFQ